MKKEHVLKCYPEYFKHIQDGTKTFEVRIKDREYEVGDTVCLKEYYPPTEESESYYTGNEIKKEITYILDDKEYCKEGYVILGLKDGYVISGLAGNYPTSGSDPLINQSCTSCGENGGCSDYVDGTCSSKGTPCDFCCVESTNPLI